jgi:hypothetical protein
MILTKEIKLKTKGLKKKQHYIDLGYDVISSDYIIVKVEDLLKACCEIIEVKCDFCDKILKTTYNKYNCSILTGGYACDKFCSRKKAIISNIEKYGVENVSQLEDIKKKKEDTSLKNWGTNHPFKSNLLKGKRKEDNLKRWGVENVSQLEIIKEKKKETTLKNWGVENPFQSELLKEKIKENNLDKWGVDNYTKTDEYKEKSKKTNLDKWGVDNYTKTDEYKEKSKKTSLDKWGVNHYSKTDEYKEKSKKYNLEKWGVEWVLQNKHIREKIKQSNLLKYGKDSANISDLYRLGRYKITSDENYISYLGNRIHLFSCESGHNFEIHSNNYYTRKENKIKLCTICNPIGSERSFLEIELYEFFLSIYDGEIIQSYRDRIEIDIYLPEFGLGFEFNGLYWHSDDYVDKNYHIDKTNYFKERDIRIIHIWEDDWVFKKDIIKSQIINLIGKTKNKIYARNCDIKEINIDQIRDFLEKNHIQGYVNSVKKLGLFYGDELISVMTFDNFEGRKKMEEGGWNLSRFCNKLGTNVVGGASKLLNYFIKKYNPLRIISYADKDWSRGDLYFKLGFKNIKESAPDYKYIFNKKRVHKSRFRKSRIKTKLTENEQMKLDGFCKIWDCGKIKFEIKY